jgi:hypothetical protein
MKVRTKSLAKKLPATFGGARCRICPLQMWSRLAALRLSELQLESLLEEWELITQTRAPNLDAESSIPPVCQRCALWQWADAARRRMSPKMVRRVRRDLTLVESITGS